MTASWACGAVCECLGGWRWPRVRQLPAPLEERTQEEVVHSFAHSFVHSLLPPGMPRWHVSSLHACLAPRAARGSCAWQPGSYLPRLNPKGTVPTGSWAQSALCLADVYSRGSGGFISTSLVLSLRARIDLDVRQKKCRGIWRAARSPLPSQRPRPQVEGAVEP
jgi:hypothetical protein